MEYMAQDPNRVRACESADLHGGCLSSSAKNKERKVPTTCLQMAGMSRSLQMPMAMASQTTAAAGRRLIL